MNEEVWHATVCMINEERPPGQILWQAKRLVWMSGERT